MVVFFNRNFSVFTYTKRMCDQGQKNLPYQNLIMHTSSSMTVLYLALLYVFKCHIQYQCAFCLCRRKNPNKTPKNLTPHPHPSKKTLTKHNITRTIKPQNSSIILSSASFYLLFKQIRNNKKLPLRALWCRKKFLPRK